MGERVKFRVALDAARQATERVLRNSVTPRQLRVFLAVLDFTAHWSKLEENVKLARIAELAGVEGQDVRERDKRVAEDLRRLAAIGAIVYRAGSGRTTSTIGLHPSETGSKPTPSDGVETDAETGSKPTLRGGRNEPRPSVQGFSKFSSSGRRNDEQTAEAAEAMYARNSAKPCAECGRRGGYGRIEGEDGLTYPCRTCHPEGVAP